LALISSVYDRANSRPPRAKFLRTPTRRLMKRLSTEQRHFLGWFEHECKAARELRQPQRKRKVLYLLKLAADKRFDPRWDPRLVRRNFNRLKYRIPQLSPTDKRCCACGGWASEPHHIILIEHGGTNSPLNIAFLCRPCHGDIHPWIKDGEVTSVLRDRGGEVVSPPVTAADTPLANVTGSRGWPSGIPL
jgi:hypothetical protein